MSSSTIYPYMHKSDVLMAPSGQQHTQMRQPVGVVRMLMKHSGGGANIWIYSQFLFGPKLNSVD